MSLWVTNADRENAVRVLAGGKPISWRRGLGLAWNRPSAPGTLIMFWAWYTRDIPPRWEGTWLMLFLVLGLWMAYTVGRFARE